MRSKITVDWVLNRQKKLAENDRYRNKEIELPSERRIL